MPQQFLYHLHIRAWTGDMTHVAIEEGWLYLAVVMDLFSRRIVGWSMKTVIDRSLVIDALEIACLQRRPESGQAIFHSDRGSQTGVLIGGSWSMGWNTPARTTPRS